MYLHDRALLDRILRFDIDGRPAALSFERRLARECGWSVAFARRVIVEYRRFLYLAMTAGHAVTPSDEVDQAWHLHMVYTESYWTRLCGRVLPRALHHNPTTGGSAEDAKFADWYQRTLDSYQSAFGVRPPMDIWPVGDERFDRLRQFRRIRTTENWIVPKATVKKGLFAFGGVACFGLLLGVGSTRAESSGAAGVVCFAIGILVLACIFAGAKGMAANKYKNRGKSASSCGGATCGSPTSSLFFGAAQANDQHHGQTGRSHHTGQCENELEQHGDASDHDSSNDSTDAGGSADGASDAGAGDSGGSGCSGGCGGGD